MANSAEGEESRLTEGDLDAAAKAGVLVPDSEGNYGFRSHAEALLMLRDQLRGWMQAGQIALWGAQVVGDVERQRLVDAVLATVDNRTLLVMCRAAARLPLWSAESLGATESLFLCAGLRMAAGTLTFRAELGELIHQVLARWDGDEDYAELPISRSVLLDTDRNDWTHASWGWSVVAPPPLSVPVALSARFPCWNSGDGDWLAVLRVPGDQYAELTTSALRRLAEAANTAATISKTIAVADTSAPEALSALVRMLCAARASGDVNPEWWRAVSGTVWALDVLSSASIAKGSDAQLRLAASLIEACSVTTGEPVYPAVAMSRRVWIQLLDGVDVRRLCSEITASGIAFVANNNHSVPRPLLMAVADRIEPAHVPTGFDWKSLFARTGVPSRRRIEQMIASDGTHRFGVIAAIWSLQPEMCLDWAAEPGSLYLDMLMMMCPKERISELVEVLRQKACAGVAHESIRGWAKSCMAEAGYRAPELLALLDLTGPAHVPE